MLQRVSLRRMCMQDNVVDGLFLGAVRSEGHQVAHKWYLEAFWI